MKLVERGGKKVRVKERKNVKKVTYCQKVNIANKK